MNWSEIGGGVVIALVAAAAAGAWKYGWKRLLPNDEESSGLAVNKSVVTDSVFAVGDNASAEKNYITDSYVHHGDIIVTPKELARQKLTKPTPLEITSRYRNFTDYEKIHAVNHWQREAVSWPVNYAWLHPYARQSYMVNFLFHEGNESVLISAEFSANRLPSLLKAARRGDKFWIMGKIQSCDDSSVHLEDDPEVSYVE